METTHERLHLIQKKLDKLKVTDIQVLFKSLVSLNETEWRWLDFQTSEVDAKIVPVNFGP
jgi:hypothetical protein